MLKIFSKQTHNISKAAYILAASSIISAFLGLLRDRLLAGAFGASANLDIYYAAFRIPNFVFGVLVSGGIIAAFLPIFAKTYHQNQADGWALTNNVLHTFALAMAILCLLLVIFAPFVIKVIAPGFSAINQQQTVQLTRLMMLSPFFLSLSNILSAVLQHFNLFYIFALSPILYNLGIIAGVLFFTKQFGIFGLAIGVVLGAFLHFFIQVPAFFKSGFKYQAIFNLKCKNLKRIFYLMIPRTFSAAVSHLNIIVITAIASTLKEGTLTIFSFAEHLRNIPVNIVGASFAVAAYPFLAKSIAKEEKEKFNKGFLLSLKQTVFYITPLMFLLVVLRKPLVSAILQAGLFGKADVLQTANVLGLFALSTFALSLIPLFSRAFFALKDTKTPFFISLSSVVLNIGFALYFINLFSEPLYGLPLAFSLSGILQLIFLCFFLIKKYGNFGLKTFLIYFAKIVLLSFALTGLFLPLFFLKISALLFVILFSSLFLLLYLLFARIFKIIT